MENLDYYPNTKTPAPKHLAKGEYRTFNKVETKDFILPDGSIEQITYNGSSISASDIFCGKCNHWNTHLNENLFFSIVGKCKNCNQPFSDEN